MTPSLMLWKMTSFAIGMMVSSREDSIVSQPGYN